MFVLFVVGPGRQHQPKQKRRKDNKRDTHKQNLSFFQGLGAFLVTGLPEEQANRKQQQNKKGLLKTKMFSVILLSCPFFLTFSLFLLLCFSFSCSVSFCLSPSLLSLPLSFASSPSSLSFIALTQLSQAKATRESEKEKKREERNNKKNKTRKGKEG